MLEAESVYTPAMVMMVDQLLQKKTYNQNSLSSDPCLGASAKVLKGKGKRTLVALLPFAALAEVVCLQPEICEVSEVIHIGGSSNLVLEQERWSS